MYCSDHRSVRTYVHISARVRLPGEKPLHLCSFYRPPRSGVNPLCNLENSIEKTTQPGQNLVIAEDFNRGDVDWDSDTVKPDAYGRAPNQKLPELVKNCSLANVQQQAIRGGRALYIYFTTNPSLVKSVAVVPGMSDHEGMAVIISDIRPTYSRPKPRIFFIFSKANCDQIQKDTAKFTLDDLKNHTLKIRQYKLEFNSKSCSCNVIKICTI